MKMNKIQQIGKEQYKAKAEEAIRSSYFVGELEGSMIQTREDFLDAVWDVFKFPVGYKSMNGYYDWICDLSWLNAEGYLFVILNYEQFMNGDQNGKNNITAGFRETVIPWWEGDVEKYVVEGKVKPFQVYLVD